MAAYDDNWNVTKGFVTDVMEEMDVLGRKVYMCGPPPMINAALNTLGKLGVKEADIHYESA